MGQRSSQMRLIRVVLLILYLLFYSLLQSHLCSISVTLLISTSSMLLAGFGLETSSGG